MPISIYHIVSLPDPAANNDSDNAQPTGYYIVLIARDGRHPEPIALIPDTDIEPHMDITDIYGAYRHAVEYAGEHNLHHVQHVASSRLCAIRRRRESGFYPQ